MVLSMFGALKLFIQAFVVFLHRLPWSSSPFCWRVGVRLAGVFGPTVGHSGWSHRRLSLRLRRWSSEMVRALSFGRLL